MTTEYQDAICPGCGSVLTGSREPGDKDYCQEAEREVTLAPANKNVDAHHVMPADGDYSERPSHRACLRGAIRAHRYGTRVAVEMPLTYTVGYRFPKPDVVVQTEPTPASRRGI